jgi:hypothetical protein
VAGLSKTKIEKILVENGLKDGAEITPEVIRSAIAAVIVANNKAITEDVGKELAIKIVKGVRMRGGDM